jgi:polysaccharide export outer membrane protein
MRRFLKPLISRTAFVLALSLVLSGAKVAAQNNTSTAQETRHSETSRECSIQSTGTPVESQDEKEALQRGPLGPVIGPGDEVDIAVYGAPDLSEHAHVGSDGEISIPLIDNVRIGGLTSNEAEGAIEAKLRQNNILNDPHVSVYVKEYGSSGISVAGEVVRPGFYSALGPHRLFDILQAAGGPTDKAANQVVITHRDQQEGIRVNISKDPTNMAASNVPLQPGDTVVVPRAGIVYVLGEVTRPGGYVLNESGGVTALQVVAVAGGPTHLASYGKTTILHRKANGFQEEKINLKKLLRGKTHDIALQADDILFVPTSGVKSAINSSMLVATAGTAAIYRIPF